MAVRSRAVDRRVAAILLTIWLLIGLAAAVQRDYFQNSNANCSKVSTILLTVVSGPLNYVGLNPKVHCEAPQPSR